MPNSTPFDHSAENRPRVFHIIPCDGLGGVETAARSAAESPDLRCDLTIYFMAGATLARDRQRIVDHPGRRLHRPQTEWRTIRDVIHARPDILVCSLWRSMFVGIVVKLLRPQTHFICFLHVDRVEWYDRAIHRIALQLADGVWADSRATLEARAGSSPKAPRIIAFVTDASPVVQAISMLGNFVSWSRLHRQKGHDRSIELINLMQDTDVIPTLDVWGWDNGERAALYQQVIKRRLDGQIRFRGPLDRRNLDDAASNATFFLQLSRSEGMAMTVVEAMQRGLIPVVTAVGEIANYVTDGVNGIIVDPTDLPGAAARLTDLMRSPQRIEAMSDAAQQTWAGKPRYAEDFCAAAQEIWRATWLRNEQPLHEGA